MNQTSRRLPTSALRVPVGPDRRAGRYDLEDDATTRQREFPQLSFGQRGALSRRPVSCRLVVLAKCRVLFSRGVRGVCGMTALEPFWEGYGQT